MDIPELLHPQYPLGSTSYCMRAAAQISLEPAKNVKNLISSPDPTLEEGKGSGDFGQKAWSSWRPVEEFARPNQIAALAQSCDSLATGM